MDEQYGREKYGREKTCPLSLGSERYDYECPMHGSSAAASDARLQQKAVKYTHRERQDLTERLQTRLVLGVKINALGMGRGTGHGKQKSSTSHVHTIIQ
jgi:hypothetical protein